MSRRVHLTRTCEIERSARVMQLEGMFDVPSAATQTFKLSGEIPDIDEDWGVGVIVGPSGAGKSSIAREAFGDHIVDGFEWADDRSILDGFPDGMGLKQITSALSSVGFSSPPAWLRPHRVLSTGEKFRVDVARAFAENQDIVVIDEFTSVVDRTVAKIGSAAVAKMARKRGTKFVAVTCHYDVIDWLEPDWVFEPHTGQLARGRLQHRPPITLQVRRVHHSAWPIFKQHHYLSADLHKASICFVAFWEGVPVAFASVLSSPHPKRSGWRGHRTVVLPDYQGVGIGNAISEHIGSIFRATGKPYASTTSHPAMIAHRTASPLWKTRRRLGFVAQSPTMKVSHKTGRSTAAFEFIGPPDYDAARAHGVLK